LFVISNCRDNYKSESVPNLHNDLISHIRHFRVPCLSLRQHLWTCWQVLGPKSISCPASNDSIHLFSVMVTWWARSWRHWLWFLNF